MNILWWVRRDLRLTDNPVLEYAARTGASVLPVYVHAPEEEAPWQPGAASNWWLARSLDSLKRQIAAQSGPLLVRSGNSASVLGELAREHQADEVVWNRLYEPHLTQRDREVEAALAAEDISCRHWPGHLLLEPQRGTKADGSPYRVFTPFWKHAQTLLSKESHLTPQPDTSWLSTVSASTPLDQLPEFQDHPWHHKLEQHWNPGEPQAQEELDEFIAHKLVRYDSSRDLMGVDGTSRLSAHLHFGEISIRRIWSRLGSASHDCSSYRAELGWREFAHHILWHYPASSTQNFNPRFDRYPWRIPDANDTALRAWQQGSTGIDIVDAAMRQLWATGWMHNRARMLVGSLLTKNLGIHWRLGARWFWDTLVDADLASNTMGWQWVAGSGVDAAPFFRIFNPETQAARFDAEQQYRRRWLADERILRSPLVDLKASRAQALAAYKDNCTASD